jgi:hypothetical protein
VSLRFDAEVATFTPRLQAAPSRQLGYERDPREETTVKKLIAGLALAAALTACGKGFTPDPNDFPGKHAGCEGSSIIHEESSDGFTGEFFSGTVSCSDGHDETWENGVRVS